MLILCKDKTFITIKQENLGFFALKKILMYIIHLGKLKNMHTTGYGEASIDDVIDDHSCDCHAESGGDVAERTVDLRLC